MAVSAQAPDRRDRARFGPKTASWPWGPCTWAEGPKLSYGPFGAPGVVGGRLRPSLAHVQHKTELGVPGTLRNVVLILTVLEVLCRPCGTRLAARSGPGPPTRVQNGRGTGPARLATTRVKRHLTVPAQAPDRRKRARVGPKTASNGLLGGAPKYGPFGALDVS